MGKFEELNFSNSTIIVFSNLELRTVKDPYIIGVDGERPYYQAIAIDAENNEYLIVWNVVDGYEEIEDESDMCDWNNPLSVSHIGK